MSKIRLALCCVVLILIGNSMGSWVLRSSAAEAIYRNKVVPDVVPVIPDELRSIYVKYWSGVEVKEGNELTPTQVKDPPLISWPSESSKVYTLALVDPDAPSRRYPINREWQHWLVGNIPGDQVCRGEVLAAYIGAAPPLGTGLHRYVFLVYEQPGYLVFDEPRLNNTSAEGRTKFSIAIFAKKYNFGDPIAGNLFKAQYDDYVPLLNKQIGAA